MARHPVMSARPRVRFGLLQSIAMLVFAMAVAVMSMRAPAQEPPPVEPETRLLEQAPYDVITLKDRAATKEKVLPLNFPNRRVPAGPKPDDVLRIRLVRQPDLEYEVRWGDIAEVRLFEMLLLDEAGRLVQAGEFDEAFEYFVYLRREAPQLVELAAAEQAWMVAEAGRAIQAERWEAALVYCRRLQQLSATHPQLSDLYGRAVENLVRVRLEHGEPAGARAALADLLAKFPKHPAGARLQDLITKGISDVVERAGRDVDEGRHAKAQESLVAALALLPDSARAAELFKKSVAAHPRIKVAVTQSSATPDASAFDWGVRRSRRLTDRLAFDVVVAAGDAPSVRYLPGTAVWEPSERDEASARIRWSVGASGEAPAFAASRALFRAARPNSPSYREDVAVRAMELRPIDSQLLEIRIGKSHPRAEGLVAAVLDGSAPCRGVGRFAEQNSAGVERSYLRRAAENAGPMEIVERKFGDENEAVVALEQGEVDVVDRIAPWHVASLQGKRDVSIVRYALPSVHLLRFKSVDGPLANAELRRAVVYAVDRETIFRNHLQPPPEDVTFRLSTGPFAAGRSNSDPLGYANSLTETARTYDPRRAFVLSKLALSTTGGAAAADASPPMLTLSYPPTATAARACERIQASLTRIGIGVELRRRNGDLPDDADLAYVVLSSVEPVVDAPAWFGIGGILELHSPAAEATVRKLSAVETFADARTLLFELQRIIHEETLLMPLWQMNEYAAFRRRVNLGSEESAPTSLYQFVDRWQATPTVSLPIP